MSHYRYPNIEGGIFFFTVVLADRSGELLVKHIERLRRVYVWSRRDASPYELTRGPLDGGEPSNVSVDLATMLRRLEEARELAMLKMHPAPAAYAVVAMARILGIMGQDEAPGSKGEIFMSDTEAARRVAFLLKLFKPTCCTCVYRRL